MLATLPLQTPLHHMLSIPLSPSLSLRNNTPRLPPRSATLRQDVCYGRCSFKRLSYNDKSQETEFVGDKWYGGWWFRLVHSSIAPAMYKSESQKELCTIRMMEKQHMCKRIEQEKFSPSTFSMQKRLSHGNNIFENDSPIELCTSLNHKRSMYNSYDGEHMCKRIE